MSQMIKLIIGIVLFITGFILLMCLFAEGVPANKVILLLWIKNWFISAPAMILIGIGSYLMTENA